MNRSINNERSSQERGDQERLIKQYIRALEIGDIDSQEQLLAQAMAMSGANGDAELEQTLWEVHLAVGSELVEQDAAASAASLQADAERVLTVARGSFSAPLAASRSEVEASLAEQAAEDAAFADHEPPPLTLRDVAARLRVDMGRMPARFTPALRYLVSRLEARSNTEPVAKEHLTERGSLSLLSQLGLEGPNIWLKKQFHEVLLSLQISREHELRLAAARRHQSARQGSRQPASATKHEPVNNAKKENIE